MHEQDPIELELKSEAHRLREKYGAPVVIVVAGSEDANVTRCMTASSFGPGKWRLRDLLGILQASIQIESLKHLTR
jgi:flavin reductase (DIM6/NTAB) family NADH-FMN oxidoreductase RutF